MDDLISRSALEKRKISIVNDNDWRMGWNDCIESIIELAPTILTISDNPTNGDMIRALFPNQNFVCEDDDVCLKLDSCILCHFSKWWWDVPYCMKEID